MVFLLLSSVGKVLSGDIMPSSDDFSSEIE